VDSPFSPAPDDNERGASAPVRRNAAALAFAAVERAFDRVFGAAANPLRQLGALGFFFFWVVTASGIYVYAFFDTSVAGAYESLDALAREQRLVGGVMRSLHRYASDAFVLVMALHMLRELVHGRFHGFRWFSWLSGVPLIWLACASGLVGYWLVWDQLAQYVGLATTEWFAALPGFDASMARNIVVGETLSDRLFSLLMFIHIGVPLLLLLGMWIHVQRLAGARTVPERSVGWMTLGTLLALSLVKPALSQAPVDLGAEATRLGFDWFYLFAYPAIHLLTPAVVWIVLLAVTGLLCFAPWMVRPIGKGRPAAAVVDPSRCNGCGRCFTDCPYAAVVMSPRRAGSGRVLSGPQLAVVNAALCAGCGLCAGACPTAAPPFSAGRGVVALKSGIELPQLPLNALRIRVEGEIDRLVGPVRLLIFGCDRGVDVRRLAAPGVAGIRLPCVGMLPPSFVEYALRGRIDGVMIAGCAEGECEFRFGLEWTRQRLAGSRAPALDAGVSRERVRLVSLYAEDHAAAVRERDAFRQGLMAGARQDVAVAIAPEAMHG